MTGAGCVQLGNILKPFLLEIFVERHFITVYLIICEALHSSPSSGVFWDVKVVMVDGGSGSVFIDLLFLFFWGCVGLRATPPPP